jgi:hypothetical protein
MKKKSFQAQFIIEFFSAYFSAQVLQRIDDVTLMCEKRIVTLKKLATKPTRPIQTVTPEPAVPLQPNTGAPHLLRNRKHSAQRVSLKHNYYIILNILESKLIFNEICCDGNKILNSLGKSGTKKVIFTSLMIMLLL